jgi:hypothetical protein
LADAAELTRRWLTDCVLALDLCPFAAPVVRDGSLRISESRADEANGCRRDFLSELDLIQSSTEAEISTTLLAFSGALTDFHEYLDFLDSAQQMLEQAGLEEQFQLASFHPQYRFESEPIGSLGNYTNRSPLPVIHIIRESMMSRVLASYPNPEAIPGRNITHLEAMGDNAVQALWAALYAD